MSDKIRWKIAYLLDRSKRFCWADLVSWALRYDHTLRDTATASRCQAGGDFNRNGCCYCGKFMTPEVRAQVDAASQPDVPS